MKMEHLDKLLQENTYPGRGIVIGQSEDGKHAVIAYFIMGRSQNSRNRVFVEDGDGIRTQAHDPAKLTDPSLIIYHPVRVLENVTVVTNGDQTDTICDFLQEGKSFQAALRTRTFEPDDPNFTPRISGVVKLKKKSFNYRLSILKSAGGNSDSVQRFFFEYLEPVPGEGQFLHTYRCDGDPIPSFVGEPVSVEIKGDIDTFTKKLWDSLNPDNKVSLFVRYIKLKSGVTETRIENKNQ